MAKRFSATLEYSRFCSLLVATEVSLLRNAPSGDERGDTAIFARWLLSLLSLLFRSFYLSMKLGSLEFSVFPYFLASSGFELKDLFPPPRPPPPPPPPKSLTSKLDVTVETDDVICGTKDVIS